MLTTVRCVWRLPHTLFSGNGFWRKWFFIFSSSRTVDRGLCSTRGRGPDAGLEGRRDEPPPWLCMPCTVRGCTVGSSDRLALGGGGSRVGSHHTGSVARAERARRCEKKYLPLSKAVRLYLRTIFRISSRPGRDLHESLFSAKVSVWAHRCCCCDL